MLTGGGGGVMESSGGGIILLTKCCSVTRFERLSLPSKLKSPHIHSGVVLVGKSRVWRCRYSRWDSNAESVGSGGFKFTFGNKNGKSEENDIVEGEAEEKGVGYKRKRKMKRKWMSDKPPTPSFDEEEEGIFEEFIDTFWVVEVFKSYGWALPPILLSWLLASGLKAFLMVLAIPFGQSVFTFVFQKLFGKPKKKPKRKVRKRRPFRGNVSDSEMDDEGLEQKQGNVKGNMGYQSWVANDNGAAAVDENGQDKPQFGGWDDLDEMESTQRRTPRMPGRSRRKPPGNGKLGMSARKSETPLLLRMLIAIFPFLWSWTKLF